MKYYDLHTHTTHSDGCSTLQQLVDAASVKGIGLGVSDHLFCCGMNTKEAVLRYLDDLEGYNVFKGCEANIGEDYSADDAIISRFDYVIASVHSYPDLSGGLVHLGKYFGERAGEPVVWERTTDPGRSEEYLTAVLAMARHAMQTQRMDIYGHCTVLPFYESLTDASFKTDWENELISLCKKYHVALEISDLWKEPGIDMVRRACDMGIQFSLGSDCHIPENSCKLDYPIQIAEEAALSPNRLFLPLKA